MSAATDITITPANSPYTIPGPSAAYGTVTLQTGGYAQMTQQTAVTITTLKR